MTDLLAMLLANLAAEGDRLRAVVAPLDASSWRFSTPAAGWDVATQVGHLVWTDEVATAAATDQNAWDSVVLAAMNDPGGFVDASALAVADVAPETLLARWDTARVGLAAALRAYPAGQKLPWFGPPMSPASMATARMMETWAHALDVYAALDVGYEPADNLRPIAHLGVRTRDFAFSAHGLEAPVEEFGVTLSAPSGDVWSWGPDDAAQTVTGSAYDFCRLVTQRLHRDDTDLVATGPDAEHWLGIAQCFAGPPGEGRQAAHD